jgi:hypothetical protein
MESNLLSYKFAACVPRGSPWTLGISQEEIPQSTIHSFPVCFRKPSRLDGRKGCLHRKTTTKKKTADIIARVAQEIFIIILFLFLFFFVSSILFLKETSLRTFLSQSTTTLLLDLNYFFFIPTSCCWGPLLQCWSVGGGAWDGPKYAAMMPRFSILLTIGKGIHPLRTKSACQYASIFPGKHVTVQQGEPSSVVVVVIVGKKKKKKSSSVLLLMMSINSGGALC